MTERIQHSVLIVSDDPSACRLLLETLAARGIHGSAVRDAQAALARIARGGWDVLMADLGAAGDELPAMLERLKRDSPEMPVILLSPPDEVSAAVGAVRAGCDDVLVKPLDRRVLADLLARLLPEAEVPVAAAARMGSARLYQIAGASRPLRETIATARKIAPASVPVLITGESGTGKELIAYLIHHESNRSRGPYVRVNCAGLSESLLESELFGHEKGAFTGAHARRKGRFELAHGGTLLLDEVSETGPRLQAELLRVLETQDFERVGGSESIRVNVRIISTTNRDLAAEVAGRRFRQDLYYRIRGVELAVPALRHRPEDIPVLAWYFVGQFAREGRRHITDLDAEMLEVFCRAHWPGNVRQLRSVVRTALILGEGPVLSLAEAPHLRAELLADEVPPAATLQLRELERRAVLEALRRTNRHYRRAAHLLGITDRTLREKLRRYRRDGQLDEDRTWALETA